MLKLKTLNLALLFVALLVITPTIQIALASPNPFYISGGVYPHSTSYTVWKDGSSYYSKNAYGYLQFSGTNFTKVFQDSHDQLTTGGTIYLTKDYYSYATGLVVTNEFVHVEGESLGNVASVGTVLHYTGSGVAVQIGSSTSSDNIHGVWVRNLMIEGTTSGAGGIKSYNAIYMTLENLHIREFYNGYGITVSSKGKFSEVCELRSLIIMRVKYGILLDNEATTNQVNYITMEFCNIYGNTTGTYQSGSIGVQIPPDYGGSEIANDNVLRDVKLWYFQRGIENSGHYTRIENPDFDRQFECAMYENGTNTLVIHPRFGSDITYSWHWGGTKTYVIDNDAFIPHECGVDVSVSNGASSHTVTLSRTQENAVYGVSVIPSWDTTVYITAKSTTQFTVTFGTNAGASDTLDWFIYRQ